MSLIAPIKMKLKSCVCIIFGVSATIALLQLQIPMLQLNKFVRIQIFHHNLSRHLLSNFSTMTNTQLNCTYSKNISVYMDGLDGVTKYLLLDYPKYVSRSLECGPFPGGGRCLFNTENTMSDAIFYCGGFQKLKYKRMFDEQIVIVFTRESEHSIYCHFPPPNKYDIKVSYRRDSTIPLPFLCDRNLGLRLVEMGQPDVPIGRQNHVAAMITNCGKIRRGYKWRADYLNEMMKYIHIDQWGECLKNTPGNFWMNRRTEGYEEMKVDFFKKNPYKFLISFENMVEDDYISEKIYESYLTRSIPIFYGDKAVFDLALGNKSFIYANNYTPKELAELIKLIDGNDTLYSEYFKNWDLVKMRKLHEKYCSEYYICAICRKVWETLYNRKCGSS